MSEAKKQSEEAIEIDENGKVAEKAKVEEKTPPKPIAVKGESRLKRFANWYKTGKKKSIPLTVLLLLLILAAIPFSRYALAGTFLKNSYSVEVIDSTAGTAISGADVSLGNIHGITNGSGKVTLNKVGVGHKQLLVSKKYYRDQSAKVLVPILKQKNVPKYQLTATGRQVKVSVKNLINHTSLADVNISVADISAKTDKSGSAILVLPAGTKSEKAKLSLDGYNNADATIQVDDKSIKENDFNLTPSGKVYFLSKLSGKIDVVKTNLDGTGRQTVLPGTGHEDDQNTVLLASRDWKYLALQSRRSGNSPSLYLIDTSNDSLTTIESDSVNFSLLGWSDNFFTYTTSRSNNQPWQPGAQSIKSYNAQTKKLATLDSTNATGTSLSDANYETYIIQPILLDNLLAYVKTWYQYPGYLQVTGQSNTLSVIKPDGGGKKTIKSVDASQSYFGSMVFHAPSSVYVQMSNINGTSSTYYEFNGTGLAQKNLTNDDVFRTYPTYLYSPDDSSTFWTEPRDGKNTLFIGDEQGLSGKQIASLTDYKPYGWFTSDYLLVSKNSSELYIMPKGGLDDKAQPVKITDYHKPAQNFFGYGGGYGGI